MCSKCTVMNGMCAYFDEQDVLYMYYDKWNVQ